MLGFDGEYPAGHPKAKFWHFLVNSCKKSAVKHTIEKPILLNYVNLSTIFCPRLYFPLQCIFYFQSNQNLHFWRPKVDQKIPWPTVTKNIKLRFDILSFSFLLPLIGSKLGATLSLFAYKMYALIGLFLQLFWNNFYLEVYITQSAFTYWKSTMETPDQCVKSVQS